MPLNPNDYEVVGSAPVAAGPPAGYRVLNAADYEELPAAGAAAPAAKTGGVESFLRGAKQGFTLGFGDEITGALESAFTDKTYAQARDEARAADAAAQAAHPWIYGGGNLAGGAASALVPGLGAAKALSLGGAVLRGAATGGVAALGGSDADLTTAEGRSGAAGEVAAGAVAGGILGGVGHGVGKWLAAAPARAEAAELGGLTEGVQNSTKVRNLGRPGSEAAARTVLREEPAIKSAIQADPKKALELVADKVEAEGNRLGGIYDKVQRATPGAGLPLRDVDAAIAGVAERYDTAAEKPIRAAIEKIRADLAEKFGGESPGGSMLSVKELHREVSAFAKQGFEGGAMFSPTVAKQLRRDVSGALRDVLQSHVDQIAESTKIPGVSLKILQATNEKYSAWRSIENLLEEKVKRQAASAPTMGSMLGELSPLKLTRKALGAAADPLDRLLAPVVKAAPGAAKALPEAGRRAFSGFGPSLPSTARAAIDGTDDDEAVAER